MSQLLQIGTTALMATEYALNVTAENISNANTDFYSRRLTKFAEAFYNNQGDGVTVSNVERIFSDVAGKNFWAKTSDYAYSSVYYDKTNNLQSFLNADPINIETMLNGLVTDFNVINVRPSSVDARNTLLNKMSALAYEFNQLSDNLESEQTDINSGISQYITDINQITSSIAALNTRISSSSEIQQLPLLDQRDNLLSQLSEYINFDSVINDEGKINIWLPSGAALVLDNTSTTMTSEISGAAENQYNIYLNDGAIKTEVGNSIQGGKLGGLLTYQNSSIDATQNALGRLALTFAQQMNSQNALGMDANGQIGGNIFNDINITALTNSRVFTHPNNLGSAGLTANVSDATLLTASDYTLQFTSATSYQLTDNTSAAVVATGTLPGTLPTSIMPSGLGFVIEIPSGSSFVGGDEFTVSPCKYGAAYFEVNLANSSGFALAQPVVVAADTNNTGQGMINLVSITDTTTSAFSTPGQLNPPINAVFDNPPTTFSLIDKTTSATILSGIPYSATTGADLFPTSSAYDPGYRVHISGLVNAGDTFSIDYNSNGKGDNRNGQLLADLMTSYNLDGGSLTYTQAYHELNYTVASQANLSKAISESNKVLKDQAEQRIDQISGVSLQEETVNLAAWQQAYAANVEVIHVGEKIFDTLISILRR